jgi:hypothetical protein
MRPKAAARALPLALALGAGPALAQECDPAFPDVCLIVPDASGEDVSPYCFLPTLARGSHTTNYATTAFSTAGTCHSFVTFLRFELPAGLLEPGAAIEQATLLVPYLFNSSFGTEPPHPPVRLRVHRVTAAWSEAAVTWASQPPYEATLLDEVDGITDFGVIELDVTQVVRDWVQGTLANHGLVLTSPDDQVLGFHSWEATVSNALKTALLIIPSACLDADADGLCDADDVCPYWPSSASEPDRDGNGIGNACECGDQNGDGSVNVLDLIAINVAVFDPSRVTPLCDTTGEGQCTVSDIVGANRKIFGLPAYCSRYPAETGR